MNRSKIIFATLSIALIAAACGNKQDASDAWGNFEAVETTVGSQGNGEIISLNVEEGDQLSKGKIVGLVDTTSLHLQKQQLGASIASLERQINSTQDQSQVIRAQLSLAKTTLARTERMHRDSAATQQQLDEANSRVVVLNRQLTATESQIAVIKANIQSAKAQIGQINNKIDKSVIVNPISGTVLVKYAETGEVASYGKPLYDIANLDTINLRVYVSGSQLPNVKLNQQVKVHVDNGSGGSRTYPGRVSWVSSQAEFTPKNIQTKENRVAEVYAVKIRVPNDGTLKIGMPASITF